MIFRGFINYTLSGEFNFSCCDVMTIKDIIFNTKESKRVGITTALATLALFVLFFFSGFNILQNRLLVKQMPKMVLTILAIVWGVGCLVFLFYSLNGLIVQLPRKLQSRVEPILFVGPATLILSWYLLLPTLRTIYLSFFDKRSNAFIGLDNYQYIFTNKTMQVAFLNNVMWIFVGTFFTVFLGLTVAILADKVKYEKVVRSLIFMPLAISFVGAGIIWRFVYAYRPVDFEQIGLFNAIRVFFGDAPVNWLLLRPWNTLFLIIIFVWLQTGFAMEILSAAIKGVPKEIIEAARVDGVGEFKIIWHIIIPSIKGTIITISTTILLLTLKIFDIVYSITNGLYGTEVLASQQFKFMFKFLDYGKGSAISVIIFVCVIPVMIYNLSRLNKGFK